VSHQSDLVVNRIKGSKAYLVRFSCSQLSDQYVITKIRNHISEMIEKSRTAQFVLDFSNITFMSSAGIGALTALSRDAKNKGGYLRLAALNRDMMQIIKVTKLDKLLAIYPTVSAASK